MKSRLLMTFLVLSLFACTVENENWEDYQTAQELELIASSFTCEPDVHRVSPSLEIEVTNDIDSIYITFNSSDGSTLQKAAIHIASDVGSFPTVGKGNLPHPKMDYQIDFRNGITNTTLSFSRDNLGECSVIAAFVTTIKGGVESSFWIGGYTGPSGDWNYFEYCIKACNEVDPCEGFSAGADNSLTLSESQAAALPSWDEVRKLYLSLLEEGVPLNGTFDPSIWEIINAHESNPIGSFTTVYTISEGECQDSVELTIHVVPDEEMEE